MMSAGQALLEAVAELAAGVEAGVEALPVLMVVGHAVAQLVMVIKVVWYTVKVWPPAATEVELPVVTAETTAEEAAAGELEAAFGELEAATGELAAAVGELTAEAPDDEPTATELL